MIKVNLSKFMGINKMTIQEVHERTGLNRNTISNLYHENVTRIDFYTIDKLCKLFACQAGPESLLEYIPDEPV
ncbi:MAG: Cro/Cl family transcriptional regulator [Firmicutes bacterium HGW-Firmicutes-15]|nr:MAG: Cro/Cl family transcriptional regulator [Firmicutes bacterium HGW-Firmicutes-15]